MNEIWMHDSQTFAYALLKFSLKKELSRLLGRYTVMEMGLICMDEIVRPAYLIEAILPHNEYRIVSNRLQAERGNAVRNQPPCWYSFPCPLIDAGGWGVISSHIGWVELILLPISMCKHQNLLELIESAVKNPYRWLMIEVSINLISHWLWIFKELQQCSWKNWAV